MPVDSLLYRPFKPQEIGRWFENPKDMASSYMEKSSCMSYWMPFLSEYDVALTSDWIHNRQLTTGQYKRLTRAFGYNTWKKEYLYYCPECVKKDRANYGETYWHRLPQLPGVHCCPEHGIPLKRSMVKRNGIRYELIPAEYLLRADNLVKDSSAALYLDHSTELRISDNSKWLLKNGLLLHNQDAIQSIIEEGSLTQEFEESLNAAYTKKVNSDKLPLAFLYKMIALNMNFTDWNTLR